MRRSECRRPSHCCPCPRPCRPRGQCCRFYRHRCRHQLTPAWPNFLWPRRACSLGWLVFVRDECSALVPRSRRGVTRTRSPSDGDGGGAPADLGPQPGCHTYVELCHTYAGGVSHGRFAPQNVGALVPDSDGLEADGQELNIKDYGEDRVWVILMNTTADAANAKPGRGGLRHGYE